MSERLKVTPVAFVALIDDKQRVLLQRRANTDYKCGWWDLLSGHIEPGETPPAAAIREAEEESGVVVLPEDLELFHIYSNENNPKVPYLGFIFRARTWKGEPAIQEADGKCDAMGFYALDDLPEPLTSQVVEALKNISGNEVTYSYFEPKNIGS